MSDELVEAVAREIAVASPEFDIRLIRLVDGNATYRATCNNESREFYCHSVALDWVNGIRESAKARAVIAVVIERCAEVAEDPGFVQARDTEWDTGFNYAKRIIAAAIRKLGESE